MRPRDEALIGIGLFAVLIMIAASLGRRGTGRVDQDRRSSSFLTGPAGARGLADALQRLGIRVRRFRERTGGLAGLPPEQRQALLVLDPTAPLAPPEVAQIVGFLGKNAGQGGDLVLAGRGAEPVMRCFGYRLSPDRYDPALAFPLRAAAGETPAAVHRTLIATRESVAVDSSRMYDIGVFRCPVPRLRSADTLLVTAGRRVAALRLAPEGALGTVTLVSDEDLFRNRGLRRTDAGPFVLGLFAGRYDRVVFEEYHHGFGASGSLAGAVFAWSLRTPWGWAVWQVVVVGLLALLFGAIRFGPARSAIVRVRRSPLEHVVALARALSAARGHDAAIEALVRGLRRRVVPPAIRGRGDATAWLRQIDRTLLAPRGRAALASLDRLTRPGQPSTAVLEAANAVEDLWEELRP
jgi:uncharacterized protein DUF4350